MSSRSGGSSQGKKRCIFGRGNASANDCLARVLSRGLVLMLLRLILCDVRPQLRSKCSFSRPIRPFFPLRSSHLGFRRLFPAFIAAARSHTVVSDASIFGCTSFFFAGAAVFIVCLFPIPSHAAILIPLFFRFAALASVAFSWHLWTLNFPMRVSTGARDPGRCREGERVTHASAPRTHPFASIECGT